MNRKFFTLMMIAGVGGFLSQSSVAIGQSLPLDPCAPLKLCYDGCKGDHRDVPVSLQICNEFCEGGFCMDNPECHLCGGDNLKAKKVHAPKQ